MSATDLPATPAVPTRPRRRRFRRLPASAYLSAAIVLFWVAVALVGPFLAPHGPGEIVDPDVFGDASRAFPLGTDYLGRDVLSRILFGAPYTLGIAAVATALASGAGTLLGLTAVVAGGWTDRLLSRGLDAVISMPSLMFGLVAVAAVGSSLPMLIAIAAVVYTPGAFRLARSLGVGINALDYIAVARARGEGHLTIVVGEVLPNIVVPVLTDFGLRFVYVVLFLSGLSFLGLGIQPPAADWGSLVRENLDGLAYGAPAVIVPALAIASLTVSVNLFIDGTFGRKR
ncbi:ABC transporter permease [Lichenibacterium dinghuense]|uniref:ABC transporter permease n=1 Tax=Lichenibacterium dinghuense TaxID=2895977 RepID=UPI001F1E3D4A|nr:ABC transporter permease [Lichenibacterium sp. 6Y81]